MQSIMDWDWGNQEEECKDPFCIYKVGGHMQQNLSYGHWPLIAFDV